MKIHVVSDEGELVGTIDQVEQYDLEKPAGRAALLEEIEELLR